MEGLGQVLRECCKMPPEPIASITADFRRWVEAGGEKDLAKWLIAAYPKAPSGAPGAEVTP